MADSVTWRRFCRIPLDGKVPHPTTLMQLTTRCGVAAVDGLNEALLAKAAQAKLLRTTRVSADTTVMPANASYPTDSSLRAKAVRRIAATGKWIQAAGGAVRTRVRDRSRSAGKKAHEIVSKLRLRTAAGRDQAQAVVRRITGEVRSRRCPRRKPPTVRPGDQVTVRELLTSLAAACADRDQRPDA